MPLGERFAWAGLMLTLASAIVLTWLTFDLHGLDRAPQRLASGKASKQHQTKVSHLDPDNHSDRKKAPDPDWAHPNCETPGTHDEADLCEQRRMSKAAEDTYKLNRIQVFLGVVGAGLVIAGLYYARQAAFAAMDAARYAGDQATAASKALAVSAAAERPFVYVKDVALEPLHTSKLNGTTLYRVIFKLKNYGRSPAFVQCFGFNSFFGLEQDIRAEPEYGMIVETSTEFVLIPGEEFDLSMGARVIDMTPADIEASKQFRAFSWLWGYVRYRDFMGGIAENGFIMSVWPKAPSALASFASQSFRMNGPAAYSYERYYEDGRSAPQPPRHTPRPHKSQ